MSLIYDGASLRDFLSYGVVYAPDFPREEFLADDDQVTLDRLLKELRGGLRYSVRIKRNPALRQSAEQLLDQAAAGYAAGDRRIGTARLQSLRDMLFG